MTKRIIWILVIVVLVVCAVILLRVRVAERAAAKPASVLPVVVATMVPTRGPVLLTLPAMGVVASDVSTLLSTKVSGQVLAVYRQEGDVVKKGDVLARIDASELEAKKRGLQSQRQGVEYQIEAKKETVKALKTALSTARDTHSRTEELLKVKGASIEQFRQEEANIASIEANLAAAQNSISTLRKSMDTLAEKIREVDSLISYATITSPIDGTVSRSLVKPGDMAMPGKPLMRIAAKTGLYLNISLPDTLHAGEAVFQGKKVPLTPKGQASTSGLVQYVVQIPDGSGVVEGQFVNVRVVVYDGNNVLMPVDSLLTMNGVSSVFVLKGDKAEKVPVHVVARGVEGVVLQEDFAGRRVIIAKPDILLRASTGVPVLELGE